MGITREFRICTTCLLSPMLVALASSSCVSLRPYGSTDIRTLRQACERQTPVHGARPARSTASPRMVPGMTHRLNGPAPSSGLQPPDRDLLAHSAPPVTHHPPQLPAPSLTSYTGSDVGSQDTSHLGKSTKAATTTKQSSAIPPYMKVPPGILSRGSELSLPDLAAQVSPLDVAICAVLMVVSCSGRLSRSRRR